MNKCKNLAMVEATASRSKKKMDTIKQFALETTAANRRLAVCHRHLSRPRPSQFSVDNTIQYHQWMCVHVLLLPLSRHGNANKTETKYNYEVCASTVCTHACVFTDSRF